MARARTRNQRREEPRSPWSGPVAAAVLDAVPEAMVVCGPDGRIVAANDALHAMLGYRPGKLVGRRLEKLVPEDLRELHRAHRTRFAADPGPGGHRAGRLFTARHHDGHTIPVEGGALVT